MIFPGNLYGKDLGAKGRLDGIVTLCFHATGQPLAQRTYSGKKDDCELPVAQRLIDKDAADQLAGSLVTGDALNAQKNGIHHSQPWWGLPVRPQGQPANYPSTRPEKALRGNPG